MRPDHASRVGSCVENRQVVCAEDGGYYPLAAPLSRVRWAYLLGWYGTVLLLVAAAAARRRNVPGRPRDR